MLESRILHSLRTCIESDLADAFAGELAGQPIYVILQSESGLQFDAAGECFGFTGPTTASLFQPLLSDRWRGIGAGMMICDCSIAHECGSATEAAVLMQTVATHEMAHILICPPTPEMADSERLAAIQRLPAELEELCNPLPRVFAAWFGHNATFIRVLFHIAARMRRRGWICPTSKLCFWDSLELPPGHVFEHVLQPEISAMAGVPLSQVLATEPPAEYLRLWARIKGVSA